jgi:hypothetical protein
LSLHAFFTASVPLSGITGEVSISTSAQATPDDSINPAVSNRLPTPYLIVILLSVCKSRWSTAPGVDHVSNIVD